MKSNHLLTARYASGRVELLSFPNKVACDEAYANLKKFQTCSSVDKGDTRTMAEKMPKGYA